MRWRGGRVYEVGAIVGGGRYAYGGYWGVWGAIGGTYYTIRHHRVVVGL